ncbi:MAG TPA: glycoside hydrolase family 3 C-terminal domain-containing protein [Candidatus Acidoferrales bacterium]
MSMPRVIASRLLSSRLARGVAAAFAVLFLAVASGVILYANQAPSGSDQRIEAILGRMTIEEKVDMIGGVEDLNIRAFPDVGIPRLKMADGPLGVRHYGPATAMAGGISMAASWDPSLAEKIGKEIGRDARAKGVNFMLGPGVNIYRAPMNGRNFEYMGEDPYLAGRIAVGYIRGMQGEGVSATVKHFIGNNSEFDRHNTDSIIDERTMREIYLPAFEAAVKEAHVGSVMDSYNLTNGSHMTQNAHLNIEILKKEWGFNGILMSDWTSTYDAVAAANGGLDLEMPSGLYLNRDKLLPAIQQGLVSVATIDDKVRRILRTAMQFRWLDGDQTDLSIPRYNREGDRVALEAAREGAVLLKNDGNLLPLSKERIKSVLVVGPDAYPAVPVGGGSAQVVPFEEVSFLQGISDYLGDSAKVFYSPGLPTTSELAAATSFSTAASAGTPGLMAEYFTNEDLQGTPFLTRTEPHVDFGPAAKMHIPDQTLSSRWTGYYSPASPGKYEVFVSTTGEDGGHYRLYVDDKLILDNWNDSRELLGSVTLSFDSTPHKVVLEKRGHSQWRGGYFRMGIVSQRSYVLEDAKKLAATADVVVVAAGFDPHSESEGGDRTFHLPVGQDELIREMAASNKNTIVLLTSGGGVDMNEWIDHVPALLEDWYPGQEGGRAAAEILFGAVNPSGRLPATFERRWEDNPVHDNYYPAEGTNRVVYKEGVFVGYRGYEHNGTKPLYPFGFGLSYTTFRYGNLVVKPADHQMRADTLSAPLFQVSFDVTNTGTRAGADVAQVYVGDTHSKVPRPAKELKGFARVDLKPGETKTSTVTLDARAFSYYDADAKQWRADPGDFQILVGRSSQEIALHGSVTLSAADSALANK